LSSAFIQLPPQSTGLKVDTSELVVNSNTVERENICVADPTTAANVANVVTSAPSGSAPGLVVWNQPSGTQTVSGSVSVSNLPSTQPVSGTVSATQGTSPWVTDLTQVANTSLGATAVVNYGSTPASVAVPAVNAFVTNTPAVTISGTPTVDIASGQTIAVTQATASNLNATVSGTVSVTNFANPLPVSQSGTWTNTVTQATASNLNATVVQSSGSNLHVDVDNFPGTQTVSGTVTANQGSAAALAAGWPVIAGQTAETTTSWTTSTALNTALALTVTGYNSVAVALNQGSTITGGVVTFEVSDTSAGTNWYALQGSESNAFVASSTYTLQASTNQGWDFNVAGWVQFRVRLSTTISGTATVNVGIAASGVPVVPEATVGGTVTANAGSGNFTVVQATASNLNANVSGTVSVNALPTGSNTIGKVDILGNAGGIMDAAGQNASSPANELLVAGQFNTTPTTITSGNVSPLQLDNAGNLLVNVKAGGGSGGNAAASATGSAVPADADYIGFNSGGNLVGVSASNPLPITGSISASNPSVGTTGTTAPTSATEIGYISGGNLVGVSSTNSLPVTVENSSIAVTGTFYQTTQPVSGTITANQGSANTAANAWPVEITDGTNVNSVKAASTAAASTDKSIVVQLNPVQPNLTTALNVSAAQATAANLNATVVGTGTFATQSTVTQATASSLNATVVPGGSAIFEVSPTTAANTNSNPFFTSVTDGTTKATVIASTAALKTDLSSVAGTATSTATAGVQLVGIEGHAAATLDAAVNTGAAPTNTLWTTDSPSTASQNALTTVVINATAQKVLKASAGNLYGAYLLNLFDTSTTTAAQVMYAQFFNTTTTTALATTSWLFNLPLPAPTVQTGTAIATGTAVPLSLPPGALALANFSSGIVVVFNTTSASATTASGTAPIGVVWLL
jgi:hypothetical protein